MSADPVMAGILDGLDLEAAIAEAHRDRPWWKDRSHAIEHPITSSMVGGCRRKAALAALGAPREPNLEAEYRQANHGTWIHDGLLPRLGAAIMEQVGGPFFDTERKVAWPSPAGVIPGRLDLFVGGLLIDLKTVAEYGLVRIARFGARAGHVAQVGAYTLGLAHEGVEVQRITVLYADRSSGETLPVEVEVEEAVLAAESWAEDVAAAVREEDLAHAPRDERGPGLSIVCDGCEFLRACWGDGAEPGKIGPQRVLLEERPAGTPLEVAIETAAATYAEAAATEKEAKERKDFARAILDGTEKGVYGSLRLSWRKGWQPRPVPDGKAALERLEELGEPIPTRLDGGRRPSIQIVPAKPAQKAIEG